MEERNSDPVLSVIIGSTGPADALTACLSALEPQREGAEVLVCETAASPAELRERFSWARFIDGPERTVPALWADGIARARGGIVALTIAPMRPAADWVETIHREHRNHDAVAGAIEPADGLGLADLAEYLCRYAPDMLPFQAHECPALPGDNASYKRDLLERTADLHREGFWEPVVHRRLAEEGVVLWHAPQLLVRQGRSGGIRAFVRQRLAHGRAHGGQRGALFGPVRNTAGVVGAPAVPLLLGFRIASELARRRRFGVRALMAQPLVLLYNVAWAVGEARGHIDALRTR